MAHRFLKRKRYFLVLSVKQNNQLLSTAHALTHPQKEVIYLIKVVLHLTPSLLQTHTNTRTSLPFIINYDFFIRKKETFFYFRTSNIKRNCPFQRNSMVSDSVQYVIYSHVIS